MPWRRGGPGACTGAGGGRDREPPWDGTRGGASYPTAPCEPWARPWSLCPPPGAGQSCDLGAPFPAGACLTLVLVAPLSTGSPTRWLFPNVSSFQPDPTAGAYGTETDSSLAAPEALTFHFCMVRGQLSAQNPPEAQRQGKAFSQSCLPDAPNGEHPLFRNHSHLQVDAAPVPGSLLAPAPRPLHSRPPPEEVCALATPPSAPRGSGQ